MKTTSGFSLLINSCSVLIFMELMFIASVRSTSCTEDGQLLVCYDCFTLVVCADESIFHCYDDNQEVCLQSGIVAACSPDIDVPACECPKIVPSTIADPYNPNKYINCEEDGAHMEQCDPEFIWNQESLSCVSTVGCSEIPMVIPIDCTHYEIMEPDCSTTMYECDNTQVFDLDTNQCEDYVAFTCSRYRGQTGLYPDTQNCSIAHVCQDGKEIGTPIMCNSGAMFDPTSGTCVTDPDAVVCPNPCTPEIPEYVQCDDGTEFFPLDCHLYYDCIETSSGSGIFEPVLETCAEGLVINIQTLRCDFPLNTATCNNG